MFAKFINGNRTEWSPIRSVIIQVVTKSDDRAARVRFVYHIFYCLYFICCLSHILLFITYFRETKNSQDMKERENLH